MLLQNSTTVFNDDSLNQIMNQNKTTGHLVVASDSVSYDNSEAINILDSFGRSQFKEGKRPTIAIQQKMSILPLS
jgi:hypothetical protein